MNKLFCLLLVLPCRPFASDANEVISATTKLAGAGLFRYHYTSKQKCDNALILGVGTAMSVSDYDMVAKQIVVSSKDTLVAFTDPEPDWFMKTSGERFAKLANAIVDEITAESGVLSSVCGDTSPQRVVIGGHSAGGEAALESIPHLKFSPNGYLGLDPYEMEEVKHHQLLQELPALFWGFVKTTCFVNVEKAAKAGYEISDPKHRILYQIQNDHNDNSTDITEETHHCVFADHGCCACPKHVPELEQEYIHAMVGKSTQRFIQAISSNSFTRSAFDLDQNDVARLFVNQDEVVGTLIQLPEEA